jgi:hypothetical protein
VAAAALMAVLAIGGIADAGAPFGCCRWLAGGCGFVVAVGLRVGLPQAGTNPYPGGHPPWSALMGAGGPNMPPFPTQLCPTRIPPLPLVLDSGPRRP